MNADDQTTAESLRPSRRRLRGIVRSGVLRFLRPYTRHRAETVTALARLEADSEHVRERHTEQIERLEDLVRELILSVEALRRAAGSSNDGGEQ